MKAQSLLPILSLVSTVIAVPTSYGPLIQVGGGLDTYANLATNLFQGVYHVFDKIIGTGKGTLNHVEQWLEDGKEYIRQNGLVYELVSHSLFVDYQLRVTEPTICDSSVKQYSGYLDIPEHKHLFFWFFESRTTPEEAPLVLWLNGGPGCSSSTGLLFELGPCTITESGKNTTHNPHSWNTHANMIFLDQPVDVGFSYASDGSKVSTSSVAGKDVYAFLELFLNRFSEYADKPFHIAAESYGGTYAPHIASVIHNENKALARTAAPAPGLKMINLASVILANGLTDPYIQMGSIADYACEGPYPVYDDPDGPQCTALRTKIPTCQRLIKYCYDYGSVFTCAPAGMYCNSQLIGPLMQLGLNPYDVRRKCDTAQDGPLCYKNIQWIDTWMNDVSHKIALGVNPSMHFSSCNMEVNQGFALQGDGMHNSAALLPELIEDGVRLLVYAGNADMMCNYIGNERWVEALEHKYHKEFVAAKPRPWVTFQSGRLAGTVRSAGGGGSTAGNVTFVTVYEAGHMVPYDQSEAALDLFTSWIMDAPLLADVRDGAGRH